ncbi:MAG: hypothetical protein J6P12_05480 [Methanobrevibacter sp.]|nr:hypothetical protein [Methanobrevibacter sp.]
MRKLLLIVLIFLLIGTVSAHENVNDTSDNLLKDIEYNYNIDDDGDAMEVEENDYVPVEVKSDEAWSLNVYIDKKASPINDEFTNETNTPLEIPTSVIVDGEEVPLALGNHKIVYEFKFTNTTSIFKPETFISDSGVSIDFKFIRNSKTPQNFTYRFNSQFNIIETVEPISETITVDDVDITRSDSLFFKIRGIKYGTAKFYLDDDFFASYDFDESPFEDELDTTKLAIGSYNFVCVVETDKVYANYTVNADNSNSMININYVKSKNVNSPNKYRTIINTTLNVREIPELNTIYVDAPPIDIKYTKSIPIYLTGDNTGDLTVYIDGKKVYENPIMLSWENAIYIPTKDANGNYFDEGTHNLSFEYVFSDKYESFNPEVSCNNNEFTFNFFETQQSNVYLNDKYVVNTKLNIIGKSSQVIPIDSNDVVRIVHTKDINIEIDELPSNCNVTVYVDEVEIYDSSLTDNTINVKTFFERTSIEETNERDIKTGTHKIRFEFNSPYQYDVNAEFKDNAMKFKFTQAVSDANPDGVIHQLNTSLIVSEKPKTVHIINVKNYTYFDDTEFIVKMDLYKPEDEEDIEDDEDPIGTQDVGIIVSDENGVVYTGDSLMNIYKRQQWNYEFENELLPKAGKYTIKIINLADNTYDTASFEVKKANRIFNRKYTSDDFNVLFTLDFSPCNDDLNDPLYITLDNKEKVIIAKKGASKSKKEVLFEDVDPGVYTATFTLKGNGIYNDVTLKSKVTVKKEEPKISYEKNGQNKLDIKIDISKSKTDTVLVVSAGGVQKEFKVNKNTKHITAEFDNLNSGTYDVDIYFRGNERYTSKTLDTELEITKYHQPPVSEPEKEDVEEDDNQPEEGKGVGNNTGGIGTGSGDSNVTGSGNGTYNGKISLNAHGSNGDLGSQGSGHSADGAKSYEITKNIKLDENSNTMLIVLIILIILLFISFIYERRDDDDEEEY